MSGADCAPMLHMWLATGVGFYLGIALTLLVSDYLDKWRED